MAAQHAVVQQIERGVDQSRIGVVVSELQHDLVFVRERREQRAAEHRGRVRDDVALHQAHAGVSARIADDVQRR